MANNIREYKEVLIAKDEPILNALKMMDQLNRKLLVVHDNFSFSGLLSIGDIQRAVLREVDLNAAIGSILRENIQLATVEDDPEEIKKIMLKNRTELMPVLDREGQLSKIIYWEDFFKEGKEKNKIDENLPVVVMAGGKGTRLKPITNIIPKPLVPIGERAFVEIIMDSFIDQGVGDFLMSVNYKADLIKYYFDNHEKDYSISYFKEEKPLGTAGSIYLMKDQLKTTFFVSNCDIIVDQDYCEILEYHRENKNELTAVAAIKSIQLPYGAMELGENGLLKSMEEKPTHNFYVNAGLYILEPHLLDEIPPSEFFHITDLMNKVMDRNGRVGVFPVSEGAWMDIGQWNNYQDTQEKFTSRFEKLRS